MNFDKKKISFVLITFTSFFIVSLLVYKLVIKADSDANKIAIKNVKITKIETGTSNFTNDGLDYNDASSYQKITGYTQGNDSNENNRIVRSFDKLTYNFNFSIAGKNDTNDYDERKVDIKVILPDDVKQYVSFTEDAAAGQNEYIYTFDGIDTYDDSFSRQITLYVLGAPNGLEITPSFEIQESTNSDSEYLVTLGKSGDKINYEYDKNSSNKYKTTSGVLGFSNYMPTVVSSKTANLKLKVLSQTNEGQKTTNDNKIGRFLTYVVGLEMIGDEENGMKGYTMPNRSDISFGINLSQNGSVTSLVTNGNWARTYGPDSINGIEPVVVAEPYSSSAAEASKRATYPGSITLDSNTATISGYDITYKPVKVNADGSEISKSEHYIGTYAITVFSERTAADGKNDIQANFSIGNASTVDTANANISIQTTSASAVNKYYENVDYSLTSEFVDGSNKKLGTRNGEGAISKGTTLTYKTIFNYKKTLSDQGLKEIIKLDTNAFRVIPKNANEDISIKVEAQDGSTLSSNDFEVKYVTGSFENSNYSYNNAYDRVAGEDLSSITSSCASNIGSYSNDQIMNLYGGPCIKANDGVEQVFNTIASAKQDEKEVPITKIIVQTKDGVKLPDSVVVTIEVSVRVRNVSDITQTYQIVTAATSSDYDSVLNYYSPRVVNGANSITNPNNYNKTVYQGSNITSIDTDSPWGDSLKIVNFTSRQDITVKNTNSDGSMKTTYNVNKGETITYNIKTSIQDNNMSVGADDVWWINNLKVYVTIPAELEYIPDSDLDKYLYGEPVISNGATYLTYSLPYTKPNMKIPEINFKASIKPTIKGSSVPITVYSRAEAININGEVDASYVGLITSDLTIYATGIENVIVSQKVGTAGSVVEKNSEFSYLLSAYNNTNNNISDYTILDILPSPNDRNSSVFSGTYKVKVKLPASLGSAKVYCSTSQYQKLNYEVLDSNNVFEECDVTEAYVNATAIKITNISINANSYMDDIEVFIKAKDNTYEDKYVNTFKGASTTYSENEANNITVKVISRNISGRVFNDNNENGIEDDNDTYVENIPLTLYKVESDNNITKIEDTVSNKDGYYKFKNLDVGKYKIRANYDKENYDLTLRYATEDTTSDSDAYKIEEGVVEISNKRTPDKSDGILVSREIESVSDMNIGLIPRRSFGFNIDKFITKVDLTYNGSTTSRDYPNLKLVKSDVKYSWKASFKVHYGIKITNDSSMPGYVKLINESIPIGSLFDPNESENIGWFYTNGTLNSVSLEGDLMEPGESRYLTLVLSIPSQDQYGSYVNTVSLLNIEQYVPEELAEDTNAQADTYTLGEALRYAGEDWHVVDIEDKEDEQVLTLLADSKPQNPVMKKHTATQDDTYKWSSSLINEYINSDYVQKTTLNTSSLIDNVICDDASGLPVASYGGTLLSEQTCQSNIYNTYKIRLLTEAEFTKVKNAGLEDYSWLYGNNNFWLQNSVYVDQEHDLYGRITDATIVKNLAKFVNKNATSVQSGYTANTSNWVRSTTNMEVRPVITISSKNIIKE